ANARWQIREEEAVALRRRHSHQPQQQGVRARANPDIGIDDLSFEEERLALKQGVEIGSREERGRQLAAGEGIDLRFPVLLESDDEPNVVLKAGTKAAEAGITEVREKTVAPPALVDSQMQGVVLARRAEVVRDGRAAADGVRLVNFDGGVVAGAGQLALYLVADLHRRGIDDAPVSDARE